MDYWFAALINLNYVENQNVTASSNCPYNSILICPSTPDVVTSGSGDGYTIQSSNGWLQPNLVAFCSYGINGTNCDTDLATSGNTSPYRGGFPCLESAPTSFSGHPTWIGYQVSTKLSQVNNPSSVVMIFDGNGINPYNSLSNRIVGRHGKQDQAFQLMQRGYTNILFIDGHAEMVPRVQLPNGGPGVTWQSSAFSDMNNNDPTNWIKDCKNNHWDYPLWRIDQPQ